MKYMTKEVIKNSEIATFCDFLRIRKKAETKNDDFFEKEFKKAYQTFLSFEKTRNTYIAPSEDIKKIEDRINAPDISEEEKQKIILFQKIYKEIEKDRIELGIYYGFDERTVKITFDEKIKARLALCSELPQDILNEIADLRLFALGYCSRKVKKMLQDYSIPLIKKYRKVLKHATKMNKSRERVLSAPIDINEFPDRIVKCLHKKDGDLYIDFEYEGILRFVNGKIIQRESEIIYQWNPDIPYSGMTRVIFAELHHADNKVELHFILQNLDFYDRTTWWYLTIKADDIIEIAENEL